MTPEDFKKRYEGTHMELSVLDTLENGSYGKGSLIVDSPGDKNITKRGKIPGKNLIESVEMEKRAVGLQHCLLDATSARVGDLMDIPMEKLVALAIKALPQKVDQKVDHNFTFAEMVKRAHLETVDVEE